MEKKEEFNWTTETRFQKLQKPKKTCSVWCFCLVRFSLVGPVQLHVGEKICFFHLSIKKKEKEKKKEKRKKKKKGDKRIDINTTQRIKIPREVIVFFFTNFTTRVLSRFCHTAHFFFLVLVYLYHERKKWEINHMVYKFCKYLGNKEWNKFISFIFFQFFFFN